MSFRRSFVPPLPAVFSGPVVAAEGGKIAKVPADAGTCD